MCTSDATTKRLELATGPSHKSPFEMIEHRLDLRGVELPIIVHPPSHAGIDELSNILDLLDISSRRNSPLSNGCPDFLGCFLADRWEKTHKIVSMTTLSSAWLKGIPEKIEGHMVEVADPVVIPAIYYFRFLRMNF
jgi:hypothetical protein